MADAEKQVFQSTIADVINAHKWLRVCRPPCSVGKRGAGGWKALLEH